MRTRSRAAKGLALFALFAVGCLGPGHGPALERDALSPAPWTAAALGVGPGDFRFAVVTDRTGEHRDGVFESALAKLELLRPAFVEIGRASGRERV